MDTNDYITEWMIADPLLSNQEAQALADALEAQESVYDQAAA